MKPANGSDRLGFVLDPILRTRLERAAGELFRDRPVLAAYAYVAPAIRHRFVKDVTTWDKTPAEPVEVPQGIGVGLAPAPRVRIVLIDGLSAQTARTPTYCFRFESI